MAKRIKRKASSRRRASFFRPKRSRRRSSSSGNALTMRTAFGAAAYGAVRERVSMALSPVTSKIPIGDVADELGLMGLAYILNKKMSNPTIKNIAKAAFIVESARLGEAVASGQVAKITSGIGGVAVSAPSFQGTII